VTDQDRTLDPAAMDRLLDVAGGDPEFVDELLDTYLEDAVSQLARMAAAAEEDGGVGGVGVGDLMIAAHSLKTNSANVGATALADLCRSLEADARLGPVPDGAERVAAIAAAFEHDRRALAELRARP
jgi:HPt (histidine-containing phosphotransfer) domain-containing protein